MPDRHRETVDAIRAQGHEVHPDAAEALSWNQPPFALDGEDRFSIVWNDGHDNLGFLQGGTAEDPDGLLEGTGKVMRSVSFPDAEAVHEPAVRALIARVG